ncbi:hypothetical protein RI129_006502 [Pyrocoelia pectoralis]|uniref:Zinc finger MYM-type protein 1-like n=1 Tax=Pyrocoelia pectoralis TaxID=417401 RepID=A0AAN7ZJQ7_9COLE
MYKHKSGFQKRKELSEKQARSSKGQQSLFNLGFLTETDISDISVASSLPFTQGKNDDISQPGQSTNIVEPVESSQSKKSIADQNSSENEIFLEFTDTDTPLTVTPSSTEVTQETHFDIGLVALDYLTPSDVENAVRCGPGPLPAKFPKDSDGKNFPVYILTQKLKNGETVKRDWLVWSDIKRSLFCFPCRLFTKLVPTLRSKLATTSGYSMDLKWKKLYNRIPEHENSVNHKECYLQWRTLELKLKNQSTITHQLFEVIKSETEIWKQLLRRFLDVTLFLGERGLAFRGENQLIGDPNNGNFLGILEIIARYDPLLQEHLNKVKISQDTHKPLQVHYLSNRIQNEFIALCAEHVMEKILEERKIAKYFSIIVDATPDSAHIEQTVFILRYVYQNVESKKYEVQERFLEFVDCNNKTGEAIADLIRKTLQKRAISLGDCRGQGYDNGSNMCGIYNGAQAHILQNNPLAIYSPCAAHSLNLCGVEASQCNAEIITFFGVVQRLYNLFSRSPQRWEILQKNIGCSLHSMSDTRWSARIDSVKPFAHHLPGLIKAVDAILTTNLTPEMRGEAYGIQEYLNSFRCVLMACIWVKVLTAIDYRNKVLQARDATIDVELDNINSLVIDLKCLRTKWDQIVCEVKLVSENMGLPSIFPQKRRRVRKRLHGESSENVTFHNEEETFKIETFYVLIDTLLGNLKRRYETLQIIFNLFSILWEYPKEDFSNENVKHRAACLVQKYNNDLNTELSEELLHLRSIHYSNLFSNRDTIKPIDLLNKILELKLEMLFPNVIIALRIFRTIPVTVAQAERSFSTLARIKNVLRSTMYQQRLTSLGTHALESSLARKSNFDQIIDNFANIKARKVALNS